jgi:hypothetical protein
MRNSSTALIWWPRLRHFTSSRTVSLSKRLSFHRFSAPTHELFYLGNSGGEINKILSIHDTLKLYGGAEVRDKFMLNNKFIILIWTFLINFIVVFFCRRDTINFGRGDNDWSVDIHAAHLFASHIVTHNL